MSMFSLAILMSLIWSSFNFFVFLPLLCNRQRANERRNKRKKKAALLEMMAITTGSLSAAEIWSTEGKVEELEEREGTPCLHWPLWHG